MDAKMMSEMRTSGRHQEICMILSDFFSEGIRRNDPAALAEGTRALLEIDPAQASLTWRQLRSVPGYLEACGPGLAWKIHLVDPASCAWNAGDWPRIPEWMPAHPEGEATEAVFPRVLSVREEGREELIEFSFLLGCPWCGEEHVLPVRRTLVFFRRYSCPGCDGPLKADGRHLRRSIPPSADPAAVRSFEDRLHGLWHDLHRAQGGHPPEAELLCQAFASHLTRVASVSLSSTRGDA